MRDDFGDLLAAAVTPEQIDKYIERRLAGKRGAKGELIPGDRPASINRSLRLLGQCFNLAVKRGKLSRAPYIRKLSEADNVRQGFFNEAEIRHVLANLPNDGLRDFVEWASLTGQRKSEIAAMRWDMLDANEIRIPAGFCKNRRARVIPLGSELLAIIERRLKRGAWSRWTARHDWQNPSFIVRACRSVTSKSPGRQLRKKWDARAVFSMILGEHARADSWPLRYHKP